MNKLLAIVPAWEKMSDLELVQLRYALKEAGHPEDKEYINNLTEYINERAKYEQAQLSKKEA